MVDLFSSLLQVCFFKDVPGTMDIDGSVIITVTILLISIGEIVDVKSVNSKARRECDQDESEQLLRKRVTCSKERESERESARERASERERERASERERERARE